MNETLYSISEELLAFMRKMEDAEARDEERGDGNISMDYTTQFENLYEKMGRKMNSMVEYIRSQEDAIDSIDKKIKSLGEVKKIRQKKVDKLYSLLMFIMNKQGLSEIDTGENIIKIKEGRWAVDVLNEEKIPDQYKQFTFDSGKLSKEQWEQLKVCLELWRKEPWNIVVTELKPIISINKTDIQNAIKWWEEVPGAWIVKSKSITII